MKKPELLCPAGDMERLRMAVLYGADAVYLAGKNFGMRGGSVNFDQKQLREAVALCHGRGVRVHVTVNTLPRCDEMREMPEYLSFLADVGADALIVADFGVFRLAQRYAPQCELHMSTQTGIVNAETASAWYELGARRVVLARELPLEEIAEIRLRTPKELELECFVHGSMCVSFSGRCLLSNYMTGRDANRGACAQPCRWKYALVEERRPGQYFEIFEGEKGTYILNSRDLCMIEHIPALIEAGIDSFKIEGRAKSSYYAACTANAYRHGIDAAASGVPLAPVWREEVQKVSHRNYYTGFFFGRQEGGQFYEDARYIRDWEVAAYVVSCAPDGEALLTQRNRFSSGDRLELVAPGREPVAFLAENLRDGDGVPVAVCNHAEMALRLRLPFAAPPYSILRRETRISDVDTSRQSR